MKFEFMCYGMSPFVSKHVSPADDMDWRALFSVSYTAHNA